MANTRVIDSRTILTSGLWSGLGLNVCHDSNDRTEPYMTTRLNELVAAGITRVRPNLLVYTTAAGNGVDQIKAYITAATNLGIYCVWGTTVNGAANLTNTTMTGAYRTRCLDLAAFGQALAHPELFELQLGNEDEDNIDGVTVTKAQFQAYVRGTLCTDVRAVAPSIARVSYSTTTGYQIDWATDGLGSLDRFGLNVYGADNVFQGQINKLQGQFGGGKYFISEWNSSDNAYADFNDDVQHAGEIQERINFIIDKGVPEAYFFGYRVPSSSPADKYSLILSNDSRRSAWYVLTGKRRKYTTDGTTTRAIEKTRFVVPSYLRTLSQVNGTDIVSITTVAAQNNLTTLSITAWIYPTGGGGGARIIQRNTGLDGGWSLRYDYTNKRLFFFHAFSGTSGQWWSGSGSIQPNEWIHIAITYNNSSVSNNPVMYKNGVSLGTLGKVTPIGTASINFDTNLYIGNRSATGNAYYGLLSNVQLYNVVLTQTQIKNIMYDHTNTESGLIGWWKCNEGSGTNLIDSSSSATNGTITGGTYSSTVPFPSRTAV